MTSTTVPRWTWEAETLSDEYLAWHERARRECLRDIVQMTHLAASGHPGGSLSSLDFYLLTYSHANIDPKDPWKPERDRIVVSHGHTSPGVYSVLAQLGFFPRDEAVATFRRVTNRFEGHIERDVPGVEWTTGNLGQGLSAACGMAIAQRLKGIDAQIFVPMGDGEQQKGQISEARRFVRKFGFNSVTAIVDLNRKQIGGDIAEIMPQDIAAGWASDGWLVIEVDGHDPAELHRALRAAVRDTHRPHVILAHTIMGKGVSFMEDTHKYHGAACNAEQYEIVVSESGDDPADWDLGPLRTRAESAEPTSLPDLPVSYPAIDPGTPRTYGPDDKSDNRGAFGKALLDVAKANARGDYTPFVAFDCDLEGSVKLDPFHAEFPGHFFESGIQEHHTATCAGALGAEDLVSVFADFGVFGVCETYNQHRLSDINHSHVKLVSTHVGLDVGEDGRTHQAIDYVGLLRNLFGMRIIVPADPNQTDRGFRHMVTEPGMAFMAMGRSKLPTILDESGQPRFAGDYEFTPGRVDWIRKGRAGAIVATGTLTGRAVQAADAMRAAGIDIAVGCLATPAEIDIPSVNELAEFPFIVTVEDHNTETGLGMTVAVGLFDQGVARPLLRLGVENYCPSGAAESVYASQGLDAAGIERSVREFMQS